MSKKDMMVGFIEEIERKKLLTLFIGNLFDYDNFCDYNYLFRMTNEEKRIIIDIYDNVSDNRFNRYIFSFVREKYDYRVIEDKNVFVNYINILNLSDSNNKLLKLGYLFKIEKTKMIEYANNFLDKEIVDCLINIINKK